MRRHPGQRGFLITWRNGVYPASEREWQEAVRNGWVVALNDRVAEVALGVEASRNGRKLTLRRQSPSGDAWMLTSFVLIRRKNPSPCVEIA
jgi:hypothetical protein